MLDAVGAQQLYEVSPASLAPEDPVVSFGAYGGQDAASMSLGMAKNLYLSPKMGGGPRKRTFIRTRRPVQTVTLFHSMSGRAGCRLWFGAEYGFEKVVKAFEVIASRRTKGKIVIKVAADQSSGERA